MALGSTEPRTETSTRSISCAIVMESGNLNFLEPSLPLQACNGTALNTCFCNESCVRQSSFVQSLSIENTVGMTYLRCIVVSGKFLYRVVLTMGHFIFVILTLGHWCCITGVNTVKVAESGTFRTKGLPVITLCRTSESSVDVYPSAPSITMERPHHLNYYNKTN